MDIGNTIKDVTVEHGQNETVYCHFVGGAIPNEADIVIVVDYTPPGFPASYTSREYFHFTGANGDRWDWNERSTPDDLRRTADTHIKKWTRS